MPKSRAESSNLGPKSANLGHFSAMINPLRQTARSNDIWRRGDGTHEFTCDFYNGDSLQEADTIYTKYAEQIRLALAKEWKFQEQVTPDRLHRKTLEGIRRYNTMKLELKLTIYKSRKHCEVTFKIEKEE